MTTFATIIAAALLIAAWRLGSSEWRMAACSAAASSFCIFLGWSETFGLPTILNQSDELYLALLAAGFAIYCHAIAGVGKTLEVDLPATDQELTCEKLEPLDRTGLAKRRSEARRTILLTAFAATTIACLTYAFRDVLLVPLLGSFGFLFALVHLMIVAGHEQESNLEASPEACARLLGECDREEEVAAFVQGIRDQRRRVLNLDIAKVNRYLAEKELRAHVKARQELYGVQIAN